MSDLELPGGFPLVDPAPAPVMVSRPCGCTSMVTEDGAVPMQVSWCDEHDPGYEAPGSHEDDQAQAEDEARWNCQQPNPCGCPDCEG